MCSSKQIKELAECNAVYEFEKTVKMYGKEYIKYYYNKLAELNGSINSTCNCQRNSNSRDNEPCCRCDSRKTNADRIRSMGDEELAEFLAEHDLSLDDNNLPMPDDWLDWLQSPVDDEVSDLENFEVRR